MINRFTWTDLSAFDVDGCKEFYAQVFGWSYRDTGYQYQIASTNGADVAGLFEMPEKFQRINMPSFWMSYIDVENADKTVETARRLGAIIEVEPVESDFGNRIALIRDPAGAGFTCQENRSGSSTLQTFGGGRCWHTLHVSDLGSVEGFYSELFDWEFRPTNDSWLFEIFQESELIGGLEVTPNELKGEKERGNH